VALIRKKGDKYTSRMRLWSGSCGLLLAAVLLVLSAESQYGYAQAILGALALVFIALAITAFRGLCVNLGKPAFCASGNTRTPGTRWAFQVLRPLTALSKVPDPWPRPVS
jgi:hypothetical protein